MSLSYGETLKKINKNLLHEPKPITYDTKKKD